MNHLRRILNRVAQEPHPFAVWNFFFLLEIALYLFGAIRLDLALNLLLFLFVLLPSPQALIRYRSVRVARFGVTLLIALLLLWHQTWLPTPSQVVDLINLYGLPSFDYMLTFFEGMFTVSTIIALLVLIVVSFLLSKKRLISMAVLPTSLVIAPLISSQFLETDESYSLVGISTAEAAGMDPGRYLDAFYAAESERKTVFTPPADGQEPFDIAVLHICSLSWDDMKQIGMDYDSPFFSQFDYLFTNFNTATGYSTPAVRRLLQANCGQRSHKDVHEDAPPEVCLLFNSLDAVGYKTFVGMSHNGDYGNFLNTIEKLTPSNTVILPTKGLEQQAIFFDGEVPLYNDYDVLQEWIEARQSTDAKRAALYYNSVLLHAGIRWVGEKRSRNDRNQFVDVTGALLEDIQAFIDSLKSSNRNTILVFVPEHGRALVGSRFQPADVRDVPLPKITKVPVGVKLIGPKYKDQAVRQNIISKPTSYMALSWLLSRYVENSPFGDTAPSVDALAFQIPRTEFVAEHEGRVVMEMDGKFMYRDAGGEWSTLSARQLE